MNREIKFRAWDKYKKIFVDAGEICFCFYGDTRIEVHPNSITYIGDTVHNGEPQGERFIIQQFTGLKDSKGNEIYDGDIITCDIYERENYDEYNSGKPIKVDYNDEYAGFYPFAKGAQWRSGCENIKVIGNVYQNPELL